MRLLLELFRSSEVSPSPRVAFADVSSAACSLERLLSDPWALALRARGGRPRVVWDEALLDRGQRAGSRPRGAGVRQLNVQRGRLLSRACCRATVAFHLWLQAATSEAMEEGQAEEGKTGVSSREAKEQKYERRIQRRQWRLGGGRAKENWINNICDETVEVRVP